MTPAEKRKLRGLVGVPLIDPEGGLFALMHDPTTGGRSHPYRWQRPIREEYRERFSFQQHERPFPTWLAVGWIEPQSPEEAQQCITQWKLRPLPIFNGYPEAYALLLAEAERLGLPRDYKTDLTVHDRQWLYSPIAPHEFIWVLRDMGTNIIPLDHEHINDRPGNTPAEILKAAGGLERGALIYYCDARNPSGLRPKTYEQALELCGWRLDEYRQLRRNKAS